MSFRRVRWSVIAQVVAVLMGAAGLLLARPAPPVRAAAAAEAPVQAAEAARATEMPMQAAQAAGAPGPPVAAAQAAAPPPSDACRAPLPLPSALPFAKSEYEHLLGRFLRDECYARWPHDRQLRATGPTVADLPDPHSPKWTTTTWGTHGTVLVYYSPDVYRWMCERDAAGGRRFVEQCRKTCAECGLDGKQPIRPIADGSMIVKLMFRNMTEEILQDPSIPVGGKRVGMALMVRDSHGSKDGWFWGSWEPPPATEASQLDWPPPVNLPYPWMGFGYYCVNCHASANNEELTFSELNNVLGDPNSFLDFYFQDQPPIAGQPHQAAAQTLEPHLRFEALQKLDSAGPTWARVPWPDPQVNRVSQPHTDYSPEFLKTFGARAIVKPGRVEIDRLFMPPEPYDHLPSGPGGPPQFLTSDQCVGCHAAGATGMHFDMTVQQAGQPAYTNLLNLAPYGEWRGSPMGLAGRDPIFFSQLETEQTAHAALGKVVPDLCLHCHGVMGQRQYCLDQFKADPKRASEVCDNTDLLGLDRNSQPIVPRDLFSRAMVDAVPFRARTEAAQRDAKYGGLARDGVSCTTCHHVDVPANINFGDTFTGDFHVGKAAEVNGPFAGPQQVPMVHALGITPVESPNLTSSKICGSCHSVVLPVFDGDKPWVRPGTKRPEIEIEQATYPEWVFSDFRDGGPAAQSCQDCHMSTSYPDLGPLSFKIAAIEEASNMPQVENRRPLSEIDLKPRSPYGRHALVGLNVFFNEIAQQFPDVLGIRIQDPMLASHGVPPLATSFNSMVQQADSATAQVAVTGIHEAGGRLMVDVQVENRAGHKLPSGVGFRRAFLRLEVLDAGGRELWVSGRTTPTGVLVDASGQAVAGELLWKSECRPMTAAEQRNYFQPHYRTITRQDQVQVYQELARDPRGKLTTSFLSLADVVKDNRLLPRGWNPSLELARGEGLGSAKLSAEALVHRVLPELPDGKGGEVDDPWYKPRSAGGKGGGGDALTYAVPLADLGGAKPASVRVTLFYQSIPPFYLQDRFCTTPARPDTSRLFFVAGHLDLDGTRAEGWKLQVVTTGTVPVPAAGAALSPGAPAAARAGVGQISHSAAAKKRKTS